MRLIALLAALALLALIAGCTAPSAPQTGTSAPTTSAPAATGTTVQATAGAVTVTAGSAQTAAGGNATVAIALAAAPNGLSGYNITVALTDPSVAEIADASFPDWALMKASTDLPAGRVALQAVDMSQQVPVGGANVTLATLTLRGLRAGSTGITITPDPGLGVQDRKGDLYAVTAVPGTLTVG